MKKQSIFLALDVSQKEKIFSLVEKTHPYILGYKLGPRLILQYGQTLIEDIKKYDSSSKIFLDFKFYDIPSSTVEAVRASYLIGADYVTVHASVGKDTLKQLAELEKELSQKRPFKILPVTVLSSVKGDSVKQKVEELAQLVVESGLNSLVCSPLEAENLKAKFKDIYLVTPGIRLKGDDQGDQRRVMTAGEAFQAGSSALVMGRSLIHAEDPVDVLKKIKESY